MRWTGPIAGDMNGGETALLQPVPGERWPYGPPDEHEDGCHLREGGLYCDCLASSSEDEDQ